MGYLVLARKYRPRNFEEVVKQEHVTTTLKNAIVGDRVAHAVLFSGPRGTGKTTVARILAKSMNCEKGPTPKPCGECKSCREIALSGAVDVYEIDGASNNGVEQVRELRENIKYMPAHSRYKIYIIDEVHMLSTAAFNALLKTLEEPPAHVMFIFATTEPHKIPLTILSRCRRHDFRRIDVGAIADHLEFICGKENVEVERESLDLISREAGGCMRDALSLLDQVMTCYGDGLTKDRILDILGVVDRKMLFEITSAILAGSIPEILSILDDIYDRGLDMKKLYADLLEQFRNLLVVKLGGDPEKLLDVAAHELRMMSRLTAELPATHLSQLFDVFFKEEPSIRYSAQPKMALEMAFIRMCQLKPALSVDELIEKLSQIKDALDSGTAIKVVSEIRTGPAPEIDKKASQSDAPLPEIKPEPNQIEEASETPPDGEPAKPSLENESETGKDDFSDRKNQESPPDKEKFDFAENPDAIWQKIVGHISRKNGLLGAMLAKSRMIGADRERMEIEAGDKGFQFKKITKCVDSIEQACDDLFGAKPEIVVRANENEDADYRSRIDRKNRLRDEALNHPLVEEAIKIFNGEVVQIKISKEDDR